MKCVTADDTRCEAVEAEGRVSGAALCSRGDATHFDC
jgi:hypothetical protein